GVGIVWIMVNAVLYRTLNGVEAALMKYPSVWRLLNRRAVTQTLDTEEREEHFAPHRAVVVGYGPIGRIVTRLLNERGIEPTIIEMNIETHKSLRAQGYRAVYGDANQREVLEQAGVGTAGRFLFRTSGGGGASEGVRNARAG